MNKYIDIMDYKNDNYPFQIFIGGRGTGKTFSALKGCILNDSKFILMRRTAQELDIMLDSDERGEGANPFKPLNKTLVRNIGLAKIRPNLAGIYNREEGENEKLLHTGAPIGYGVALSTVSSIRGIDFQECSDMVYDEFIPESHVRKIKNEGSALFNAYETINRNREFEGLPPMRLWLLANSNNIYNEIFIALKIVSDVERMVKKGQEHRYYPERGLAVHIIRNNKEFVEAKSNTALYKLTAGTDFSEMSLKNNFAYNDFSLIGYKPLTGYSPIVAIDNAYIYRKKGVKELYVTYAAGKCTHYSTKHAQDVKNFQRNYCGLISNCYINSLITFESYELKQLVLDIIL